MLTWTEAVTSAVRRIAATKADGVFSRRELVEEEGTQMCSDTGTMGETPMQTVSRELQQLRDAGVIEFVDNRGTYRLRD
jgi:putative restriction endonuclease